MHLLAEENISINRNVSVVFDYVTNMERFGDWFPGVLAIESANNGSHGEVGKEYLETVSVPLRGKRKVRIVVRDLRQNAFFATEGKLPPLMPRMEVVFSRGNADACNVTWRMFSRNSGWLFRLTLLPLARRVMKKRAKAGMKKLKEKLERAKHVATAN